MLFCALGSIKGWSDESLGLYAIMVPLMIALGYDRMVTVSVITVAPFVGAAAATINPFNIGIAASKAGVSIAIVSACAYAARIEHGRDGRLYVPYARRVKTNPAKSLCGIGAEEAALAEADSRPPEPLTGTHVAVIALVAFTFEDYTATGQPESRFNANGSTNAWRYYPDGRVKREIQFNGAYWQTTYDDIDRITIRVFYSAAGVPEATNSAQLDRRGNVIQHVDEAGNVFITTFDGLDRAKVSAGPAIVTVQSQENPFTFVVTYVTNVLQQVVTNFYDAAGRSVTNINALGEKTITTLDAIGRPTSKLIYNTSGTLAHESYMSYSADHNSVTTTAGSGVGAVVNTTYTDNDGHTVLSIAYPSATSTEFTLNQFDLVGNPVSQLHDSSASGVVTTWTTTTNSFDGLNRVTSKVDRDGARTTFSYDSMNDLTNRTMPGGLQWQASYNNAGQILQEQNFGGGTPTRTTTYSYYPSGNAFAGLLQTKTAADAKVSPAWSSMTISRRTFLRSLSVVSSAIILRASMIGIPASTNTLS